MPVHAVFCDFKRMVCCLRGAAKAALGLSALVLVSFMASPVHARDKSFEPGRDQAKDADFAFDEEQTQWKEQQVELWAYPEDEDLLKVPEYSASANLVQFIDAKTLSVGEDGVVRYTVVLESATGVRNVSLEGLRCDSNEYRVYGYGTRDKKVRPLKSSAWKPLYKTKNKGFRKRLAENLICNGYGSPNSQERILEQLEHGDGVEDNYERFYGF